MFVCFFCTARWIYAENENCHIFGFLNFHTTNAWWSVQRYYMMWYFEGMIYIFSPFNYHFALSIIVVRTDLILFWLFEYTNRFSSVNHTNSIKTGLLSKVWTRYLLAEVQSSRGRICIENSKATDKYWNISIPFSTNQYLLIPFEFSILVCPSNIMRFRTKEIFQQVTLMSKMTMIIFLLVSRHLKQNASYHGILFS